MTPLVLVHHAARRGARFPPNSIRGLQACIETQARCVEVDAIPLRGGGFALLHSSTLDDETDGVGPVSARSADEIGNLQRVWNGSATGEPVGQLADALRLLETQPFPLELQLDLKPDIPPTAGVLAELVGALQPVKGRIRVSSPADWLVRRLHSLDPQLPLGYDPLLYLELGDDSEEPRPPFRVGAYGYRDEHPLASRLWGSTRDYLAARAEALWAQAPSASSWYISAPLLARTLDDGFDWIADLHGRGAMVVAWTLDADGDGHVALARRLAAAGVDRITTNDPVTLASALDLEVVY